MPFTLPPLPYAPEALEPHIDKMTMEIHHGKHHNAYVTNLNKALESATALADKTLEELLAEGRNLRQEIFNLRLQQASAQLEKPARLHTLRRNIARIETRLTQLRKKAA